MKFLPPADLLERFSGVEQGLRNNQKGGRLAGLGLVLSLAQLVVATGVFQDDRLSSAQRWWIGAAVLLLAASIVLFARSRVWIRESSAPFRYTCSVAEFKKLGPTTESDCSEVPEWIMYDLAEKLNERIRRLSFLEDGQPEKEPPGEGTNEHIHISGDLLVRRRKDKKRWIHVAPQVRIGKKGEPATLAQSVSEVWRASSADDEALHTSGRLTVDPDDYENVIERVYFNLASHIYRQIQADILRKISLLPTNYLRATAYLYEADDYADSKTLDGLDQAMELYRSAMEMYDPCLRPRPKGRVRRALSTFTRLKARIVRGLRRAGAIVVPRLGKVEVRTARAEVGLANAMLHRRSLAGMSGRRVNSIYEAPLLARSAIARLRRLSGDVPGRQQALFDAHVSHALACYQLESPWEGRKSLERARTVCPNTYDQDPRYLYVHGLLEELPSSALRFLRLAVERQPRFEVAQFELALKAEMTWRARSVFEEEPAKAILDEYEEVLKLNPGNISAWGHAAYMYWLLGDEEKARSYYHAGRVFKQIKRETTIAELDYGLARIAAEQRRPSAAADQQGRETGEDEQGSDGEGPLAEAYRRYVSAASAQLLQGVSDWKCSSAQFYFFEVMSGAMMRRYEEYRENALAFLEGGEPRDARVREIVRSFVENDYGEACYSYHLRNYDADRLAMAEASFKTARDLNREAILPYYNLYLLYMHSGRFVEAIEELEKLESMEPSWADALLARVASRADAASKEVSRKTSLTGGPWRDSARDKINQVVESPEVRRSLRRLVPHSWLWRERANGDAEFRWDVFAGRPRRDVCWERDLDELHVQALFEWTLAQLYAERFSRSPSRYRYFRRTVAPRVLSCIESHFWPGNFRLLFTLHQLETEKEWGKSGRKENLRALVRRWLAENPTAYWVLDLVATEFYDLEERPLELFSRKERVSFLRNAGNELRPKDGAAPSNPRLLAWVEERLAEATAVADAGVPAGVG